jgi:hypothetical protein
MLLNQRTGFRTFFAAAVIGLAALIGVAATTTPAQASQPNGSGGSIPLSRMTALAMCNSSLSGGIVHFPTVRLNEWG